MEHGSLASQVLSVILLGEGDVQILLLADLHADHLILEAGDEGVAADDQGLILSGAALKGHAVHRAGIVQLHGVTGGHSAILHVHGTGGLLLILLDAGVHHVIGDNLLLHLDLQALVLAQLHVGAHEHLAGELQILALADLLHVHLGTVHGLEALRLDGRGIHLGEDDVQSVVIEHAFAVHGLDQLAGGLALAEAGDVDTAAHLQICLIHGLVELLGRHDDGQLGLVAGKLLIGMAHDGLFPPA